jgi:hypothetical protein
MAYVSKEWVTVHKTITCSGADAQLQNLFTLTGAVEARIWGECTEATEATVLATCYIDLWDGTLATELTDNAGVDLAGITVGGLVYKAGVATSPLVFKTNATGWMVDSPGFEDLAAPFFIGKKTGAATTVRFCSDGAAATDVDMRFHCQYKKLTDDGTLTAA